MPATFHGELASISDEENKERQLSGQLYYAFRQHLVEERLRCHNAQDAFNDLRNPTRRERVRLWRDITNDKRPLPDEDADPTKDEALFDDTDPWVESPIKCDYGYNIKLAPGSYVNSHACFIDTTPITIGANTLCGPNCSFYSGTHPLDPATRSGLRGPENGAPITVGPDCWLGGNVTILPGVTVGRGSTIGAGSVVTKDVGDFVLVAGNPARVVRRIETSLDESGGGAGVTVKLVGEEVAGRRGAEGPMGEMARRLEQQGI